MCFFDIYLRRDCIEQNTVFEDIVGDKRVEVYFTYDVSGLNAYAIPARIKLPAKPYVNNPSQPSLTYLWPGFTPNSHPVGGS